jgi:hypothetical protein
MKVQVFHPRVCWLIASSMPIFFDVDDIHATWRIWPRDSLWTCMDIVSIAPNLSLMFPCPRTKKKEKRKERCHWQFGIQTTEQVDWDVTGYYV